MPPKSPEIDAYLRGLKDPAARKTLSALRTQLHKLVPGATETISYRMPTLLRDGQTVVAFAFFGKSCGLYPFSGAVIPSLADQLQGYRTSKGGVTFPPDDPLPPKLVKAIVTARLKEMASAPKPKAKAEKGARITDRVTDARVKEATGRNWKAWFTHLDKQGGKTLDHKALVALLAAEVDSSWWRQSISVAYEQARGKRVVGQTAATGFQVGVIRTLPLSEDEAWELVLEKPEKWLGARVPFEVGSSYEVPRRRGAPGARGVVRVVKPGTRVRMTYQPDGWAKPATLQLTVTPKPRGVVFGVHMEKLPDATAREQMRAHWAKVLTSLAPS